MYRSFLQSMMMWGLILFSETAFSSDLIHLYHLAQKNDPLYLSAREQLGVSSALSRQARSVCLPSVVATLDTQHLKTTPQDTSSSPLSQSSSTATWALTVQQPIFDPKAWRIYRSSQLNNQAAKYQFQVAEYNLVQRLVDAYLDLLLAQKNVSSLLFHKKVIGQQLSQARRKFELGATTIADVRQIQSQYYQAESDIVRAHTNQRVRDAALAIIVGENIEILEASLSPETLNLSHLEMEGWSLSHFIHEAHLHSPSVLSGQLLFQAAQNDVAVQKAAYLPRINFIASVSRNDNLDQSNNKVSPPALGPSSPAVSAKNVSYGVNLVVPLFAGGGLRAKVDEFANRFLIAQQKYREAYANAGFLAEQNYLDFRSGLAEIRALKEALSAAKIALSANELSYKTGAKVLLDVLTSENQVFQIMIQLNNAVVRSFKAYIRLKTATGTFSEKDLDFIDAHLHEGNSL